MAADKDMVRTCWFVLVGVNGFPPSSVANDECDVGANLSPWGVGSVSPGSSLTLSHLRLKKSSLREHEIVRFGRERHLGEEQFWVPPGPAVTSD